MKAGQICRIITPEGPQVGDLNIWSEQNPREGIWAARARQLHASHLSTDDRLLSCLPYPRSMGTIIDGWLGSKHYGIDEFGGRCHDLLGTRFVQATMRASLLIPCRCSPDGRPNCGASRLQPTDPVIKMLSGEDFRFSLPF